MTLDGALLDELPGKTRGRPKAAWRERLEANPGKWMAIRLYKTPKGGGYRPKPGFEFATRTLGGQRLLFGRFVGPKAQPSAEQAAEHAGHEHRPL